MMYQQEHTYSYSLCMYYIMYTVCEELAVIVAGLSAHHPRSVLVQVGTA